MVRHGLRLASNGIDVTRLDHYFHSKFTNGLGESAVRIALTSWQSGVTKVLTFVKAMLEN
jgi:hypothetical protein